MPRDRTTQQLHERPDGHGQNDLTDAGKKVKGRKRHPSGPSSGRCCRSGEGWDGRAGSTFGRCPAGPVYPVHGMPVARVTLWISTVFHRPDPFSRMAAERAPGAYRASSPGPRAAVSGALRGAGRRPGRQPVGEDHGERRPPRPPRRQEGEGEEKAPDRGRRRPPRPPRRQEGEGEEKAPDRGRRRHTGRHDGSHRRHPGPGRRTGPDRGAAGDGAHGVRAVRRRWPPGSEAAGAAWGDGVAGRDRDRRKTGGCQRVHGSPPPVGRGADLRLDGPVPPPVEGLRAPLREPAGIRGEASRATGPGVSEARTNAGRPPVPAQAGGEGVNSMKDNGLIISVTYESNSM